MQRVRARTRTTRRSVDRVDTSTDVSATISEIFPKLTTVTPEVVLLHDFAAPTDEIVAAVEVLSAAAPFRRLRTPGGKSMSAAMTSCGDCGWYSDARGYRYESLDPLSGQS
ncbi:MAG: hypothetical protein FJ160_11420, partial [Gammaproteobacteria bacterium]|nr:hypothetical protein [Gammaproteobacteria bacterium]